MNKIPFRFNPRHLFFPLVLLLYRREPPHSRGQYLHTFGHHDKGDRLVEVIYGKCEGLRFGSLVFSADAPHISIERKDGFRLEHDFFSDPESHLRLGLDGVLTLHRRGEPALQICNVKTLHMMQIIHVHHRLPKELEGRVRIHAE